MTRIARTLLSAADALQRPAGTVYIPDKAEIRDRSVARNELIKMGLVYV